MKVNQTYCRYP